MEESPIAPTPRSNHRQTPEHHTGHEQDDENYSPGDPRQPGRQDDRGSMELHGEYVRHHDANGHGTEHDEGNHEPPRPGSSRRTTPLVIV